ncbi:MAG: hypothetical protein AABY22_27130 [Nanoarchaeota archaeon]
MAEGARMKIKEAKEQIEMNPIKRIKELQLELEQAGTVMQEAKAVNKLESWKEALKAVQELLDKEWGNIEADFDVMHKIKDEISEWQEELE